LVVIRQRSTERQRADADRIHTLSNQWAETELNLDDQRQVNTTMKKILDSQKNAYLDLTNNFAQLSGNLEKTASSLKEAQDEVNKRDAKIAELESQNNTLDQRALSLSQSITNLTQQIERTQQKLAASEGDKDFLEKELQRLMAEKAELERQFNDLTVLRAQVSKLKSELSISRRLDWIRRGIMSSFGQKGAEKLMQSMSSTSAPPTQAKSDHYDLNVEVNSDGTVRVIPPLTNSPASTNGSATP
ncbi:MAG TPA: hypothetical protein VKA67_06620, partial [Verrucomicrobiae bacterium]|nr:hypothetical protein [Verrucomicrobiae bacterium]